MTKSRIDCTACGHTAEDHEPDGQCWNGSGHGNRCGCREYVSDTGCYCVELDCLAEIPAYDIPAWDASGGLCHHCRDSRRQLDGSPHEDDAPCDCWQCQPHLWGDEP